LRRWERRGGMEDMVRIGEEMTAMRIVKRRRGGEGGARRRRRRRGGGMMRPKMRRAIDVIGT